jgi:uncharacterized glyoxalase superfamily protein PhnB
VNGSHIHLKTRDLPACLEWLKSVWELTPDYGDEGMATFTFGGVAVVFDASDHDSEATLAFLSEDCNADYERMTSRGAETIEPPMDRFWGVRNAYLKGPGGLTLEIEQELTRAER